MNLGRLTILIAAGSLTVVSTMGAKGCGTTGDPRPRPKPSAGKSFSCGYQVEGAGGHATGTFDIGDDGKPAYKLDFSPPIRKGSSFRCHAGSKMTLDVSINDGKEHRLQGKLRRKGEQVDECHAGTFLRMVAVSPKIHCQYVPLGQN